jgi:cytochrome c-type biogenesis protein CcmH/NrfG
MHRCVRLYLSFLLALGLALSSSAKSPLPKEKTRLQSLLAAEQTASTSALWLQAKAAMEQGNFVDARRLLRKAVEQDPRDGALWFHLGVSCVEVNELDEAIAALEHARSLAPKQPDSYFNLGLAYWKKGNVKKAKEAYRAGLALRPTETSALQNYSILLMKTEDYNSAIAPLQQLQKDPKLGISPRVALMECYLKTGQLSSASKEADEIIGGKLATPAEQTKLAAILLQDDAPELAARLLTNSISIDPNQANANAALGEIYLRRKKYPEAADCFHAALELDPESAEYAFGFVRVLLASRRPSQVVAFLKSVDGRFGALPNYQYALGLGLYGEHHYTEAAAILEKLLMSNPPRRDKVDHVLGDAYFAMGRLDDAEAAYRKALEENPKNPDYYLSYATLLRHEGPEKLDDAILRLKSAQRISPGDWRIGLQLGLCYESKGEYADAAPLLEHAIQKDPDLTAAHVALASTYFRLGRKEDGEREKKTIAELERKQQQELVQEYSTGGLIEESKQQVPAEPGH